MVNNRKQHTRRKAAAQGVRDVIPEPNKISASTPYDFRGKNLTPYGGLLPVATMPEKLGFQSLVEESVTAKRVTKAMPWLRIPSDADQRSEVMTIAIPKSCRSRFRADGDHDSGGKPITFRRSSEWRSASSESFS